MFKRKPKEAAAVIAAPPQPDPELVAALEVVRELVRKFHEKTDSYISTVTGGH